MDDDPEDEPVPEVSPERGNTLVQKNEREFAMGSIIYQESIRDDGEEGNSEANTVVHEIGHLFERPMVGEDFHKHAGVMSDAVRKGRSSKYAPETLERIRTRNFSAV